MKKFTLVKKENNFQIHWEKKSVNELIDGDGNKFLTIEGYASTKDKDRGNDIVEPKAFENALATYMTNPIVLLQHKHDKPIGTVTDARVDSKGLYIKANITQDIDGVMSAIKNGVLRTFSIGYGLKEGDYEINEFIDDNGNADYTTTIKNLELYEISVVSVPMNAYALMKSIEDCFKVEDVEDEKEDEVVEENGDGTNREIEAQEEIEGESKGEGENSENEWAEISEETSTEEWVEVEENKEEVEVEKEDEDGEKEETLQGNINFQLKEEDGNEEKVEEKVEEQVEDEKVEDSNLDNESQISQEWEKIEGEKQLEEDVVNDEWEVKEDEVEEKVADENSEIESTEVAESSENEAETPTDDNVSDEKSTDGVVETKSMDGDSSESKSFSISEKELNEMIEKRFHAEFEENKKEVENLKGELGKMKDLLKSTIQVLGEMDGALRNTVIKTGATYSQVAKKQSAWGEVVRQAQKAVGAL